MGPKTLCVCARVVPCVVCVVRVCPMGTLTRRTHTHEQACTHTHTHNTHQCVGRETRRMTTKKGQTHTHTHTCMHVCCCCCWTQPKTEGPRNGSRAREHLVDNK